MTSNQVRIVKQGFAAIAPYPERASALFFARLFEIDPAMRLLFPGDLRRRGARLIHAVELIVEDLHRPHVFVPALEALALRLAGHGFERSHYLAVGEAIAQTARTLLGDRFTAEVAAAIDAAFGELSARMLDSVRFEWRLAA